MQTIMPLVRSEGIFNRLTSNHKTFELIKGLQIYHRPRKRRGNSTAARSSDDGAARIAYTFGNYNKLCWLNLFGDLRGARAFYIYSNISLLKRLFSSCTHSRVHTLNLQVSIIGVVTAGIPLLLVLPLCAHGSLLQQLVKRRDGKGPLYQAGTRMHAIICGVAQGMHHLTKHHVVHR